MGQKNVIELAESLEPQGFELNQWRARSRQPLRIAANVLLTIAARRAGLDVPVWAAVLPIVSVAVRAASMAMLFSSLKGAGITMSANSQPLAALPDGVSAWNGWANRLVFAAYYLWVIVAAKAVLTKA